MKLVLLGLLLTAGCFPDIGDIRFETTSTSIRAIAPGDGTTRVTICPPPGGLLSCNTNGAYDVTVGGQTVSATAVWGVFEAGFSLDPTGMDVVVTRSDGATATVTVPVGFAVTSPAPGTISRTGSDGIVLRWEPSGSGATMAWSIFADCGSMTVGTDEDDDGELRLSGSDFPSVDTTCSAVVTLAREQDGVVAESYPASSRIIGAQERTVSFTLRP